MKGRREYLISGSLRLYMKILFLIKLTITVLSFNYCIATEIYKLKLDVLAPKTDRCVSTVYIRGGSSVNQLLLLLIVLDLIVSILI